MKIHKFVFPLLIAIFVGAGCWLAPAKTPAPAPVPAASAASSTDIELDTGGDDMATTLTAGGDASSTAPKPQPTQWDRTSTPGGVAFTPPSGYWVTTIDNLYTSYLIPGTAPAPSVEDPRAAAVLKSVATFTPLQNDPTSFPTWDRFVTTMAQFGCASGTTDANFVTCSDKATVVSTGKTDGGLPYEVFTLPATLKKTGASRGVRTFIVVRLADDSNNGIMVSVLDESKASVALELAKSMKVQK